MLLLIGSSRWNRGCSRRGPHSVYSHAAEISLAVSAEDVMVHEIQKEHDARDAVIVEKHVPYLRTVTVKVEEVFVAYNAQIKMRRMGRSRR